MALEKQAASNHVDLATIQMHYLDWGGEDPPILLLHPNRTNARVWDFVVEHSAATNCWLAPDQRGHGLSDYPSSGYGYADYLGDIRAFLRLVGIDRVHLVGAATGGNLSLLLASESPDLVVTLTVIDPGLSLDPGINSAVQSQIANEFVFDSLDAARVAMPFSDAWSDEMKDHYVRYSFRPLGDGKVQWRYLPAGVSETEHILVEPIWDRIAVGCPTLIVRGAGSAVFPADNMVRLQELIPAAATTEIEAGHRVTQDNPEALARALDQLLAQSG